MATETSETQPVTFINVPLPSSLHRRLRIKAIEHDQSLKEAVIEAVEGWTNWSND